MIQRQLTDLMFRILERFARNAMLEEAHSSESDEVSPVESKMDDIIALGRSLELLVKDTHYNVNITHENIEAFKYRIMSNVERNQTDLLSLQKIFVQFKRGILESRASVMGKLNFLLEA